MRREGEVTGGKLQPTLWFERREGCGGSSTLAGVFHHLMNYGPDLNAMAILDAGVSIVDPGQKKNETPTAAFIRSDIKNPSTSRVICVEAEEAAAGERHRNFQTWKVCEECTVSVREHVRRAAASYGFSTG